MGTVVLYLDIAFKAFAHAVMACLSFASHRPRTR